MLICMLLKMQILNLLMTHSVSLVIILKILLYCDLNIGIGCLQGFNNVMMLKLSFDEELDLQMVLLSNSNHEYMSLYSTISHCVNEDRFYIEFILNIRCCTFKIVNARLDQSFAFQNSVDIVSNIYFIAYFFASFAPELVSDIAIILRKPIILSQTVKSL
jgi:hypothetical protein